MLLHCIKCFDLCLLAVQTTLLYRGDDPQHAVVIVRQHLFEFGQERTEIVQNLLAARRAGGLYHTILEKQQCLCIKDLKISGKDLIEDGMKPGKEMGEILAKLLELVLEEPQRNEREWLIGKSRELRNTEG